ncbi:MAG: alpha/beta hydrolase [Parachlamydiales bacterium]|nr:alpha/beta hydrolase [Parachlamydiales bacterium]
MPFAKVNGINLYYEREGKGHPLLLIGGYGCDIFWWDTVRAALARKFDLILFDNRCSGRSECPTKSFTILDMAKDAVGLIEKLGLKRPHVIGHSMGGAIVQTIAYKYPKLIGKVVLSQTFMKLRPVSIAALGHITQLRVENGSVRSQMEAMVPWVFSNAFIANKDKREGFIQKMMANPFPMSLEGQLKQSEALIGFDSTKWAHKISVPILIIGGEEDYICPYVDVEGLAKKIKSCKMHVFPKMSHNSQLEIPQQYCKLVISFLSK